MLRAAKQADGLFLVLFFVVGLGLVFAVAEDDASSAHKQWEAYKADFKKTYDDPDAEAERFGVFKESLKRVKALNKKNGGGSVFGLTFTSDLYKHEKPQRGRKGYGDTRFLSTAPTSDALASAAPKAVDWRLSRAVTPVKNQGQCGSCWAFSTAETVESGWFLAGGSKSGSSGADVPHLLSAQQIASCVASCDGCGGGDTVTAFDYLAGESNGLAPLTFWGYAQGLTPLNTCSGKSCTESCDSHNLTDLSEYAFYTGPAAPVSGFTYATPGCTGSCKTQDYAKLSANVAKHGPASICVNAGAWDDYTGGVMTASACGASGFDDLDHCVQLVGYNATAEKPYWLVRNSWSTNWGEEGYIRLQYDTNACGLANEATQATFAAADASTDSDDARKQRLRALAQGKELTAETETEERLMPVEPESEPLFDPAMAATNPVLTCIETHCLHPAITCVGDTGCDGMLTCAKGCAVGATQAACVTKCVPTTPDAATTALLSCAVTNKCIKTAPTAAASGALRGDSSTTTDSDPASLLPEGSGASMLPEGSGAGLVPEGSGAGLLPGAGDDKPDSSTPASLLPEGSGASLMPGAGDDKPTGPRTDNGIASVVAVFAGLACVAVLGLMSFKFQNEARAYLSRRGYFQRTGTRQTLILMSSPRPQVTTESKLQDDRAGAYNPFVVDDSDL